MKKTILTLGLAISAYCSHAQNTYPWPSTGNIGIGTISPVGQLSLNNQVTNPASTGDPVNYSASSAVAGQAILNSYYVFNSDGSGQYPRYFDIASVGGPDGTNGGGNIRFLTNPIATSSPAVERMRINSAGFVGIGTTTPFAKLSIVTTGSANPMSFQANSGGAWSIGPNVGGTSGDDTFGIYSYTWGPGHHSKPLVQFSSNGATFFNPEDGNVGIGTTDPLTKLDVVGKIRGLASGSYNDLFSQLSIGIVDGSTTYSGVQPIARFSNNSSGGITKIILSDSQLSDANITYKADASPINRVLGFSANSSYNDFIINGLGNVGIGTTDTHNYKLAVKGNVIAESVTVMLNGNWPDYVFKPKYNLPSLKEVKTYIDQNQHLPDMPSEAEVAENGINLGEIVNVQTKKIEELTLYLIEKDKDIIEQSKQLADQQKINQSLQSQIDQLAKKN